MTSSEFLTMELPQARVRVGERVCRRVKWRWLRPIVSWLYSLVSVERELPPSKFVTFSRDKLHDSIKEAAFALLDNHITPKNVYMGYGEFDALCTTLRDCFPIPITFETNLYYKVLRSPRICGLKIHVLPWMKGILITP